ncbi:copper amine oxidase N-terminal domain-containing protein [Paenibacillus sp. NPDC057967]|uniref:copper amine oxidase N-terminal domain-containing protein n=1 Tax=Paenibacillus sp. NPDC057967 TaxID=3346293 RepID=UPI0036DC5BEC
MSYKKIVLSGLIFATAATFHHVPYSSAAEAARSVEFKINEASYVNHTGKHALASAPFILNGNAMVPVRALAESLGADVSWNDKENSVTLSRDKVNLVKVTDRSNLAWNEKGEQIKLPEAVQRVKGMLFVPARTLASLMGAKVEWGASDRKVTISATSAEAIQVMYKFDQDQEGWKGGFADLPVKYEKDIYELEYARELLPDQGSTSNYGLKLKGHNRSDDLFMFLTRGVEGFEPNTIYDVKLDFALYTAEAGGMVGIGGAPGEGVYVKAGILSKEPAAVPTPQAGEEYFRMNVDIGNQSLSGKDAKVLGNVIKPDSEKEGYQRVDFQYSAQVKADENGKIYLLIGTDSGFEGLTTLYYDEIKVTATKA